MGQCGAWLLCLGLLLLVLLQDFVFSKRLCRTRRQMDAWRRRSGQAGWSSDNGRYQGVVSLPIHLVNPGSFSHPPALDDNLGFGRGSVGRPAQGLRARQLQPPESSPIRVQCGEDRMVVTVQRDLYGNGKLVKVSDLTVGPESCRAGPQSSDTTVVFEIRLQECGNSLQMTPDWLIYGTNLTFNPASSAPNMPITRSSPAVISIECYYPRFSNVSSNAIKPTWFPFATTVSSEDQLTFSLHLMTEDWTAPRSSLVFSLGDIFHIEASVETQNHMPMTLFIDSCVATTSSDLNAIPRHELIAYHGCLMDGTQEDSSSSFRSPRPQLDKLQFMVDAFRFLDSQESTIYITCSLRAAAETQIPDSMNKACSYSKSSNSWSAVEGPRDICRCCDAQNCAATAGQRSNWDPSYRRPRLGRREAAQGPWSEDKWALASLGPLLVLGEAQSHSLAGQGSGPVEMWLLLGVGCLGLVVLVGIAVLVPSLKKTVPRECA